MSDGRVTKPQAMTVAMEHRGTTSVVAVSGEVDLNSSPALEQRLASAMSEAPETLLLDLSEVEFLDSTAVHLLIRAGARSAERQIRLVVVRPTGPAATVLDVCRLADHLPLVTAESPNPSPRHAHVR